MPKLRVVAAMAAGAMGLLAPGLAHAHFTLMAPANWATQGSLGVPEKSAPCGQADPGPAAVPSNIVTTFRPGQTITVSLTEDVPHPGWYKAVLSQNGMSGLPADPTVTPGTTACGTVDTTAKTIVGLKPEDPAVFPVLVDNALFHTGNLTGTQTFNVTLPSNVTCTNCVLQIVEFMSNHGLNNPGGCFYHHCANIAIQGAAVDAGTGSGGSSGGTGGKTDAGSDRPTGAGGTAMPGTGMGGSTAGVGGTSGGAGGSTSGGAGGTTGSAGGTTGSEGGTSGGAGGTSGVDNSSGGCSCSLGSGARDSVGGLVGLLLAIFAMRGRRHRRGRVSG